MLKFSLKTPVCCALSDFTEQVVICVFPFQQIWAGPLSGYRVALLLVNRGPWRYSITANWDDLGIPPKSVVEARDLWEVNC